MEPELLKALVAVESAYNPYAVSRAGARGLTQVIPSTAISLGQHPDALWDSRQSLGQYQGQKTMRNATPAVKSGDSRGEGDKGNER